jgi:outer membrane protein assembly factor BamB
MILEENIAFITGAFDEFENVHLSRFNTVTAQEEWRICIPTNVMVVNEAYLYIWGRDPGLVIAYDKETGREVWREQVDHLFPIIDAISVTSYGLLVESRNRTATRFHLLDPETGKKKQTFRSGTEWRAFLLEHGSSAYSVMRGDKIAEGVVPWQTSVDFEHNPGSRPMRLIVEEDVVLAYQSSPTIDYTQIAVLNKDSGELLWRRDTHLKSNLAVADDKLFLVTEDTELVSVDLITGQFSTQVTFTPGIWGIAGENTDAVIAADERQVLVYFSSSHQLFAFRFLPEE